jgi:MazG family protein
MSTPAYEFQRLVEIMATLRGPNGCPWDREQTFRSLSQFVLEEAYEVVDAIERGDESALREEIGDHIFEGVFLAQIASDLGWFTVAESLAAVSDKLVRRHPHVFQDDGRVHDAASKDRAPSADAALSRWDSQKAQEKSAYGRSASALGDLPHSLPALLRAYKLGKRAAGVGFDWSAPGDVVDKIAEEVAELREALGLAGRDAAARAARDLSAERGTSVRRIVPDPDASEERDMSANRASEGSRNTNAGRGPAAEPIMNAEPSMNAERGLAADRVEEEMGDLLFAIANLSRKLGIEPEAALRKANQKFERRFTAMERHITESGRTMAEMTLDELEREWQRVK